MAKMERMPREVQREDLIGSISMAVDGSAATACDGGSSFGLDLSFLPLRFFLDPFRLLPLEDCSVVVLSAFFAELSITTV